MGDVDCGTPQQALGGGEVGRGVVVKVGCKGREDRQKKIHEEGEREPYDDGESSNHGRRSCLPQEPAGVHCEGGSGDSPPCKKKQSDEMSRRKDEDGFMIGSIKEEGSGGEGEISTSQEWNAAGTHDSVTTNKQRESDDPHPPRAPLRLSLHMTKHREHERFSFGLMPLCRDSLPKEVAEDLLPLLPTTPRTPTLSLGVGNSRGEGKSYSPSCLTAGNKALALGAFVQAMKDRSSGVHEEAEESALRDESTQTKARECEADTKGEVEVVVPCDKIKEEEEEDSSHSLHRFENEKRRPDITHEPWEGEDKDEGLEKRRKRQRKDDGTSSRSKGVEVYWGGGGDCQESSSSCCEGEEHAKSELNVDERGDSKNGKDRGGGEEELNDLIGRRRRSSSSSMSTMLVLPVERRRSPESDGLHRPGSRKRGIEQELMNCDAVSSRGTQREEGEQDAKAYSSRGLESQDVEEGKEGEGASSGGGSEAEGGAGMMVVKTACGSSRNSDSSGVTDTTTPHDDIDGEDDRGEPGLFFSHSDEATKKTCGVSGPYSSLRVCSSSAVATSCASSSDERKLAPCGLNMISRDVLESLHRKDNVFPSSYPYDSCHNSNNGSSVNFLLSSDVPPSNSILSSHSSSPSSVCSETSMISSSRILKEPKPQTTTMPTGTTAPSGAVVVTCTNLGELYEKREDQGVYKKAGHSETEDVEGVGTEADTTASSLSSRGEVMSPSVSLALVSGVIKSKQCSGHDASSSRLPRMRPLVRDFVRYIFAARVDEERQLVAKVITDAFSLCCSKQDSVVPSQGHKDGRMKLVSQQPATNAVNEFTSAQGGQKGETSVSSSSSFLSFPPTSSRPSQQLPDGESRSVVCEENWEREKTKKLTEDCSKGKTLTSAGGPSARQNDSESLPGDIKEKTACCPGEIVREGLAGFLRERRRAGLMALHLKQHLLSLLQFLQQYMETTRSSEKEEKKESGVLSSLDFGLHMEQLFRAHVTLLSADQLSPFACTEGGNVVAALGEESSRKSFFSSRHHTNEAMVKEPVTEREVYKETFGDVRPVDSKSVLTVRKNVKEDLQGVKQEGLLARERPSLLMTGKDIPEESHIGHSFWNGEDTLAAEEEVVRGLSACMVNYILTFADLLVLGCVDSPELINEAETRLRVLLEGQRSNRSFVKRSYENTLCSNAVLTDQRGDESRQLSRKTDTGLDANDERKVCGDGLSPGSSRPNEGGHGGNSLSCDSGRSLCCETASPLVKQAAGFAISASVMIAIPNIHQALKSLENLYGSKGVTSTDAELLLRFDQVGPSFLLPTARAGESKQGHNDVGCRLVCKADRSHEARRSSPGPARYLCELTQRLNSSSSQCGDFGAPRGECRHKEEPHTLHHEEKSLSQAHGSLAPPSQSAGLQRDTTEQLTDANTGSATPHDMEELGAGGGSVFFAPLYSTTLPASFDFEGPTTGGDERDHDWFGDSYNPSRSHPSPDVDSSFFQLPSSPPDCFVFESQCNPREADGPPGGSRLQGDGLLRSRKEPADSVSARGRDHLQSSRRSTGDTRDMHRRPEDRPGGLGEELFFAATAGGQTMPDAEMTDDRLASGDDAVFRFPPDRSYLRSGAGVFGQAENAESLAVSTLRDADVRCRGLDTVNGRDRGSASFDGWAGNQRARVTDHAGDRGERARKAALSHTSKDSLAQISRLGVETPSSGSSAAWLRENAARCKGGSLHVDGQQGRGHRSTVVGGSQMNGSRPVGAPTQTHVSSSVERQEAADHDAEDIDFDVPHTHTSELGFTSQQTRLSSLRCQGEVAEFPLPGKETGQAVRSTTGEPQSALGTSRRAVQAGAGPSTKEAASSSCVDEKMSGVVTEGGGPRSEDLEPSAACENMVLPAAGDLHDIRRPMRGVYFDKTQLSWIGSFYEDRRQIKKRFKIDTYGFHQAKALAIGVRMAYEHRLRASREVIGAAALASPSVDVTGGPTRGGSGFPRRTSAAEAAAAIAAAAIAVRQRERRPRINDQRLARARNKRPAAADTNDAFTDLSSGTRPPPDVREESLDGGGPVCKRSAEESLLPYSASAAGSATPYTENLTSRLSTESSRTGTRGEQFKRIANGETTAVEEQPFGSSSSYALDESTAPGVEVGPKTQTEEQQQQGWDERTCPADHSGVKSVLSQLVEHGQNRSLVGQIVTQIANDRSMGGEIDYASLIAKLTGHPTGEAKGTLQASCDIFANKLGSLPSHAGDGVQNDILLAGQENMVQPLTERFEAVVNGEGEGGTTPAESFSAGGGSMLAVKDFQQTRQGEAQIAPPSQADHYNLSQCQRHHQQLEEHLQQLVELQKQVQACGEAGTHSTAPQEVHHRGGSSKALGKMQMRWKGEPPDAMTSSLSGKSDGLSTPGSRPARQGAMDNKATGSPSAVYSMNLPLGVFYTDRKHAYCANWYEGKRQVKRYFSISKLGQTEARRMAIATRQEAEKRESESRRRRAAVREAGADAATALCAALTRNCGLVTGHQLHTQGGMGTDQFPFLSACDTPDGAPGGSTLRENTDHATAGPSWPHTGGVSQLPRDDDDQALCCPVTHSGFAGGRVPSQLIWESDGSVEGDCRGSKGSEIPPETQQKPRSRGGYGPLQSSSHSRVEGNGGGSNAGPFVSFPGTCTALVSESPYEGEPPRISKVGGTASISPQARGQHLGGECHQSADSDRIIAVNKELADALAAVSGALTTDKRTREAMLLTDQGSPGSSGLSALPNEDAVGSHRPKGAKEMTCAFSSESRNAVISSPGVRSEALNQAYSP